MAESVPGTLRVSNDCIADLAGYAALEAYGIVGMAFIDANEGVARLLPNSRLRKGIDVDLKDGQLAIDMHVIVEEGVNMSTVSANLKDNVAFLIKRIAEIDSVLVTVHIEGMRTH